MLEGIAIVLAALVAISVIVGRWMNRAQRRLAMERRSFNQFEFMEKLRSLEVDEEVAAAVWSEFAGRCVKGVSPNPDDHLINFCQIDGEEVEFIVMVMFDRFGLPKPSCADPEIIPDIATVADFAMYLTRRRRELVSIRS